MSYRRAAAPLPRWTAVCVAAVVCLAGSVGAASASPTAQASVDLGSASTFAVVAGTAVTSTGQSVVDGNLGAGAGVTGFPPGVVTGAVHSGDAAASRASTDTAAAYDDLAGRSPATAVAAQLGGLTLGPGVYAGGALGLNGTVTLDAGGDPARCSSFGPQAR